MDVDVSVISDHNIKQTDKMIQLSYIFFFTQTSCEIKNELLIDVSVRNLK